MIFRRQREELNLLLTVKDSQRLEYCLSGRVMKLGFSDYFECQEMIGEGASSKVFISKKKQDGKEYAVKIIPSSFYSQFEENHKILQNEIGIMSEMNHPNVVSLIDVYYEKQNYIIVQEKLEGPTLQHYIDQNGQFSADQIKSFMVQILSAIYYLHSKDIIHRDIKPSNFIVKQISGETKLVLIDFGMAIRAKQQPFFFPKCGTPGYVAPEIMQVKNKDETYSEKCDIFSAGAIFFRLYNISSSLRLSGKNLMKKTNYSFKELVVACNITQSMSVNSLFIEKDAISLLKDMLQIKPRYRISAEQALKSPYCSECSDPTPRTRAIYFDYKKIVETRDSESVLGELDTGRDYFDEKVPRRNIPLLKKIQSKEMLEAITAKAYLCNNSPKYQLNSNFDFDRVENGLNTPRTPSSPMSQINLLNPHFSFYTKQDQGIVKMNMEVQSPAKRMNRRFIYMSGY